MLLMADVYVDSGILYTCKKFRAKIISITIGMDSENCTCEGFIDC